MKTFARMLDGVVLEVVQFANKKLLDGAFHPDVAAQFVDASGQRIAPGWLYLDGSFIAPETSAPDLNELKGLLNVEIDAAAERERLKYITGGAGQAMTYAQKTQQALLFLSSTDAEHLDLTLLQAEVGITAETIDEVARIVAEAHSRWLKIGAAIEAVRLATKMAISKAATGEEAREKFHSVDWPSGE